MKLKILTLIFFINFFSFSQEKTRDVLYLKNGSVIKGQITEMNPSTGIKIKTSDGSLFVYKMNKVLKTEKEEFVGQQQNEQTSSEISQKALDNFFINYLNNKRPALSFVGIGKVNGIRKEVFGKKIYEIEYELIFDTKTEIYVNTAIVGSAFSNRFVNDFSYTTKQAKGYEAALAGKKKKLAKGQRIVAKGSINFEETDNGWRATGFKNKNFKTVSSNYVSPDMAKRIAREKAKQKEELKAELDWIKEDTEPAMFKKKFYSLKNVPFFEYGNSSFLIQPYRNFKGRNDVASKVQNTFYKSLISTNRILKSDEETYSQSSNQAYFSFLISRVNFNFKKTGYQCNIKAIGKIEGTYNEPKKYSFKYSIKLNSKSSIYNKKMSKAQALEDALKDFDRNVRAMIFKYEPIQLKLASTETNRRGNKVKKIIFEKPTPFINISKMDFIITRSGEVVLENGKFKINDILGKCTFKGKIVGDKIICKVRGRKNKKRLKKVINKKLPFIGISSF